MSKEQLVKELEKLIKKGHELEKNDNDDFEKWRIMSLHALKRIHGEASNDYKLFEKTSTSPPIWSFTTERTPDYEGYYRSAMNTYLSILDATKESLESGFIKLDEKNEDKNGIPRGYIIIVVGIVFFAIVQFVSFDQSGPINKILLSSPILVSSINPPFVDNYTFVDTNDFKTISEVGYNKFKNWGNVIELPLNNTNDKWAITKIVGTIENKIYQIDIIYFYFNETNNLADVEYYATPGRITFESLDNSYKLKFEELKNNELYYRLIQKKPFGLFNDLGLTITYFTILFGYTGFINKEKIINFFKKRIVLK